MDSIAPQRTLRQHMKNEWYELSGLVRRLDWREYWRDTLLFVVVLLQGFYLSLIPAYYSGWGWLVVGTAAGAGLGVWVVLKTREGDEW